MTTLWASELEILDYHFHQALLTEDMKALEYFGISVDVQTNGTGQLLS